jgi:hypothetical protein
VRAAGALPELGFGFFDRLAEGAIVPRSLDGPLDFVTVGADAAQETSKESPGGPHRSAGEADGGCLKFGHEAIAAAIAIKLELIPFVCRVIRVVPGELKAHQG